MKPKLLMFFVGALILSLPVVAQQKTITGKVTSSEDGQSIPGATVRVKGTTNAVQTNNAGIYSIKANSEDLLQFAYLGMTSKEQVVGSSTIINIVLNPDSKALNEVVVTAYGVERSAKSLGYSTPKVDGNEVNDTQREAFFNGLQGRVPGLSVNPTSGNPGASSQVVLRGFVSISGNNSPLFVVDGLPIDNSILSEGDLVTNSPNRESDYTNRGADINPADIESYVIMKGPEATAMFGNLGANGAILITTKKAKAGKGSISYNNNFGIEKQINYPEIQQVYNSGQNGVYDGLTTLYHGPRYPEGTKIFNNIDQFFQTGFTQRHNVVLEGGSDKYTYRWSNEFSDNKGTIPNTSYSRISSRLTSTANINSIFKVTTSINYINTDNDKVTKGESGFLMSLLRFPSRFDINNWIDEQGNRKLRVGTIYSEFDNPFWEVYKNLKNDKTDRVTLNSDLQLNPTKWLTVKAIFGADISNTNGSSFFHPQSYAGSGSATAPTGGEAVIYERLSKTLNGSLTASAKHKFGDFNNTYIVGATISDVNIVTNSQYGQNFYEPNFYSINNTLLTTQRNRTATNRYRGLGAFAQAVLGYKTLLYLTLSGRADGASRLMPNDPYFVYPSGSFAFNFTDLEGLKKYKWLSSGKLRGSIALTGKEPWRTYATQSNFEGSSATGGGFAYGLYGGNPDLKPETTINMEAGLEMGFLNDRLSFDFTLYRLRSKDQIINPRLSYGGGFVLKLMNGGEIENKGIEVQLTGTPIKKKDFTWRSTLNYTLNRGKVISLAEELPELYDSDAWYSDIRTSAFPGSSTGSIGGRKLARNNAGQVLINPATGLPYTTAVERYTPIGDRTPKFTLGFVNNLTFKDFSLSFLWDLRVGGDVFNMTEYVNYTRGISPKTLDREQPRIVVGVLNDGMQNTATPTPNSIAVTPYYNSLFYSSTVAAEMFVERSINTLRLRDIRLGYILPKKLVSRLPFQSVSAFVTFTDVVLFTNYSGMDPESNSNNPSLGGIGGFGIDFGNMGRPLRMNFGLAIKL